MHGSDPALVVERAGAEDGRLVVSTDDATAVASSIRGAAGVG